MDILPFPFYSCNQRIRDDHMTEVGLYLYSYLNKRNIELDVNL